MQKVENNDLIKRILKDSFGGVMFNITPSATEKYNTEDLKELINLYNKLTGTEKDGLGGLNQGAIDYVKEILKERGEYEKV